MGIMNVLWNSESSMTGAEIIDASPDRKWKESSIYALMKLLVKKGAAKQVQSKPTMTKNARAYKPNITLERYLASTVVRAKEGTGIKLDIDKFMEHLKALNNES